MYYGLVYYPDIDLSAIQRIRSRFDPTADLIAPHIGLLFPVPDSIGEDVIIHHIEKVLSKWRPFQIQICGFTKSWDHWLFLTVKVGNGKVIKLHDQIYTGPLVSYRRGEIEFIPHISLGLFVKSETDYSLKNPQELELDTQRYRKALHQAQQQSLDFQCAIDKLHMIALSDDYSKIDTVKVFAL